MIQERKYFEIVSTDVNVEIRKSDYYNWLKANKVNDIIGTKTKIEYLNTIGFDIKKHKLREEYHYVLKNIEDIYFRDIIVSTFEINIPKINKTYPIDKISNIRIFDRPRVSIDKYKPTFLSNEKICFECISASNIKLELYFINNKIQLNPLKNWSTDLLNLADEIEKTMNE